MAITNYLGFSVQGLGFRVCVAVMEPLKKGTLLKDLGTPIVPFCPFFFGVSLLKPKSSQKGTLIINGLLGNLETGCFRNCPVS